jgi:voltage-gated potassium channel Kch
VYCILINRFQFLREQAEQPHHFTVANTRAMLCEIVASRILRRFDDNNTGPRGLLLLSHILVQAFDPFQNASYRTIREHSHLEVSVTNRDQARSLTTLEIAIISNSKTFLASSPSQKVVEAIYQGKIVYSPTSFLDILPDRYKQKPIALYDPAQAPLLNQYRLNVPRTRNVMELIQFVILLILYVAVMDEQIYTHISAMELVFDVYAWGWFLDQFASTLEHGWQVYTQNLWAFLDVIFMADFLVYFVIRVNAHNYGNEPQAELAFSILAAGAPVLIPRLAFNLLSENMLFLSLRAMMSDFIVLTFLAVWSFAGFLLALNWLSHETHPPITIAKWMLYVWFGLDGSGIQRSVDFHRILGPILMVTFAFLGNTLFLTILVSMLSNTFASIVNNATAEIQFRRTVLTFESVKADAIFAFYPPFNLFALLVLLPLKAVLSPRWFHKIVVLTVRIINAPWLLLIGFFERRALWQEAHKLHRVKPRRWPWDMSRLAAHYDIQTVFEAGPPESVLESDKDDDEGEGTTDGEDGSKSGKRVKEALAPIRQVAGQLQEAVKDIDIETHTRRFDTIDAAVDRLEKMLQAMKEKMD